MTNTRIRSAHIQRWLTVLVTLILTVALCLSCLELYLKGTAPENLTPEGVRIQDIFTRENVGQKLTGLAPVASLWALLLILCVLLPREAVKHPGIDPENALRLMRPRVVETPAMVAQRMNRRGYRIATGVVTTGCLAYIAVYMTDVRNFTSWDLEMVMGQMFHNLALPAGIAIVCLCLCQVLLGRSYAAEWNEAKQAPKRSEPAQQPTARKKFPENTVRIVIAVTAIIFIAAGICNGGMFDVFVKAINICTECIGLG